ncbi:MAG: DegT/DnrJ/EryC1/StrS family aminotransferase [Candidatus Sumerlaeota bacterium]|nr:DegT/DnrJ/EryC1/StrS family aminotransferase [Candidatus Sumerlaeota bacterium]
MEEFGNILKSMRLFLGPNVQNFEKAFAEYCGVKHCIGVGSGTDALVLALRALGVGPGDEVITVSHTFVATWEAIALIGATAVFVDVDPKAMTMDARALEKAITKKTKVILPVHLYGRAANMDEICRAAKKHGLRVLEDSCQAHGAIYQGKRAGALGDAAAFSFYFSKNLGACGEAGGITTNDDDMAKHIRALRDHGGHTKYHHDYLGTNARLDEMQAAILLRKLPFLDRWNDRRREIAALYRKGLAGAEGVTLPEDPGAEEHVYHLYVIQTDRRDAMLDFLKANGVEAGIHYPIPIHQQAAYQSTGGAAASLPVTEALCKRIVSLPMHPCLTDDEVAYVCATVRKFLESAS